MRAMRFVADLRPDRISAAMARQVEVSLELSAFCTLDELAIAIRAEAGEGS